MKREYRHCALPLSKSVTVAIWIQKLELSNSYIVDFPLFLCWVDFLPSKDSIALDNITSSSYPNLSVFSVLG